MGKTVQQTSSAGPDDSFDIFELMHTLWQGRWLMLVITLLCTTVGITYAFLAPEWYRSEVVMVQAQGKGLSGNLGQLASIASLAGVNLDAANSDAQQPRAVLKSREFAREFIEEKQLLTVLLSGKWDEKAGGWKPRLFRGDPDIRDAVEYFDQKVREVTQDNKTGILTLAITWRDAAVSSEWANEIARRVNASLRGKALAEAERNIKFLQGEIAATNVPSLQQSIGKVLESEMQKLLLARGNDEFAFKVVDRAFEPNQRVAPQRLIIGIASLLLGMVLSVVVLVTRKALRERSAARNTKESR